MAPLPMPWSPGRIRIAGLLIAGAVVVLDQASKAWALSALFAPGRAIEITGFLNFAPVWNRGVSFGLLASDAALLPIALSGLAGAVSIFLCLWLWRAKSRILAIALGFVIGGAVGNIIDRIRYDAVADFIDLHLGNLHWPAFNIADSAITLGVALLLVEGFLPSLAGRAPETGEAADRKGRSDEGS